MCNAFSDKSKQLLKGTYDATWAHITKAKLSMAKQSTLSGIEMKYNNITAYS